MTIVHGQSLTLGILVALCLAPGRSYSQDAPAWREIRYRESSQNVPNPERGFYAPRMSHRISRLDGLRQRGITLLLIEVNLKAFKEGDLTPEKLDEVRRAFAAARQNGLKAIVRFAYGFTGRDYRSDPEGHEPHPRPHPSAREGIPGESRCALRRCRRDSSAPGASGTGRTGATRPRCKPVDRCSSRCSTPCRDPITVHVRRPMFIRDIFAGEPGGAELNEATAYGGSRLSRVGWHDDAMLSLPTDMGTYAQRGWDRERELRWCAEHGRFTPFGGETVPSSARTPIVTGRPRTGTAPRDLPQQQLPQGDARWLAESGVSGRHRLTSISNAGSGYRLVADRLRIDEGGQTRRDAPRRAGPAQRRFRLAAHAEARRPWCSARAIGLTASPSRTPTLADGPRRPAPSR